MQAAIYARVSTERQGREQTIESQLTLLKAWVRDQGHELSPEHIYTDEGYSGSRLDRPGLDRLRDAVQDAAVGVIAVLSPDRLARKYAYQVLLLEEFRRNGCEVVFLQHPISDDPNDQLLLQIQGAIAGYERALLGERFRRGKLQKARAGQYLAGTAPYGYRYIHKQDGVPGHLVIDETEAEFVRMLYRWLIEEQLTIRQILKRLNFGPWYPRSGKHPWSPSVVHRILADPLYTGTAYTNRYRFVPPKKPRTHGPRTSENTCRQPRPKEEWIPIPIPAIIDAETHERAQAQLARNAQLSFRHNTKYSYLLRCLLTCKTCGLAMYGTTYKATASQPERRYYECHGKDCILSARTEKCPQRPARGEELDAAVWEHVCSLLRDPEQLVAQFEAYSKEVQDGADSERQALQRLEGQLKRLDREERRLIDAYQSEVIDLDELRERRQALEERRQTLRHHHEQERQRQRHAAHAQDVLDDLRSFCDRIQSRLTNASFEEKQSILQLLIERIIVGDDTLEIRHVIPLRNPGQPPTGPAPPNSGLRSDGVHPTPLPACSVQDGRNGCLEPFVGVARHQPDTGESARDQAAQEAEPEGTILAGTDIQPQDFPLATCVHADGDDQCHADHPTILPHLGERGIKPNVRVGSLEATIPEPLYLGIERLAEPRHLALADPGHPQGLHEIVHPPGTHTMDIRFLHHGNQRLFSALPRRQEAREVAVISHPRHTAFDRPHPRVPRSLSGSIPVASSLSGPLVPLGAQMLAHLQLHYLLGEQANSFPEKVRILQLCLAQELLQCHP